MFTHNYYVCLGDHISKKEASLMNGVSLSIVKLYIVLVLRRNPFSSKLGFLEECSSNSCIDIPWHVTFNNPFSILVACMHHKFTFATCRQPLIIIIHSRTHTHTHTLPMHTHTHPHPHTHTYTHKPYASVLPSTCTVVTGCDHAGMYFELTKIILV